MPALCEVRGLSKLFGAVAALSEVDVDFNDGEILGIIGANGSGKTTLFNCVTGFLRADTGHVLWLGRDVTGHSPNRLARAGLIRTFQQPMCFRSETVTKNVEMALAVSGARAPLGLETVDELVALVGLDAVADQPAALLPYGLLRSLGVALALAANPQLLLLDEPGAGLNDGELKHFAALLRRLRDRGVAIAVVDHDMDFLLPLVDRLVVLDAGRKLAEGVPEEVRRAPAVIEAYLGTRFAETRSNGRPAARPTPSLDVGEALSVQGVSVFYGAVAAARDVSLVVRAGEAVALLGPNGAGKTSLLRAISHLLPASGMVLLDGQVLRGGADQVARLGLAHVLEGRHIFTQLTVRENLLVPRLATGRREYEEVLEQVLEMFPMLRENSSRLGGQLSGGQQQQLSIARSLLTRPKVLILDEPSLGLAPVAVDLLRESLSYFREHFDTALLIAEQSLPLALDIADRYYLLRRGRVIESESTRGEGVHERILNAYLGEIPGPHETATTVRSEQVGR